jgi:hypothetical protein
MDIACPVCGRPVHREQRPGRPKTYDSVTCRKRAERQRLRHLAKLGAAIEKAMQSI